MSIGGKDSQASRTNQLSLLDSTSQPAALPLTLKAAITQAIRACACSRYEIAAKLSERLDRDISKTLLDRWTAESDTEHRVPADAVALLCVITGDMRPLKTLVAAAGCELVEAHERPELELARLRVEKVRLERRIKTLEGRR